MSKSILNTQKYICYRCGKYGQTEVHHIFGAYNRKKSTEDGLVVNLCPDCHNRPPQTAIPTTPRTELIEERKSEGVEAPEEMLRKLKERLKG